MRRFVYFLVLVSFFVAGCSSMGGGTKPTAQAPPTVMVAGPIDMKLKKKATTTISGKGFKAGQEVNIIFTAKDGMQSDIGYALKPAPKADSSGAWTTTWQVGDFIARKMVKAGESYPIKVTDSEYNSLAQAVVTFAK
jgi:hypothetical protein